MMKYFDKDTIQAISDAAKKHLSATPVTCPKFMALMEADPSEKDEFTLLIRRCLSDEIAVKMGPSGGYVLKSAIAEVEKENPIVDADVRAKIISYLSKGQKVSTADLMVDFGIKERKRIADVVSRLTEFKAIKKAGIVYRKTSP